MLRKTFCLLFVGVSLFSVCGCEYARTHTAKEVLAGDPWNQADKWFAEKRDVWQGNKPSTVKPEENRSKRSPVVVCRSQQCAPANLSMTSEYIYNSLLQLFDNNNYSTALICQASDSVHTCLNNYITLPVKVGAVPTHAYIDSVKITDVILNKKQDNINLILNYNLTYGGQVASCTPSKSILFVRDIDHILLEDSQYTCKMTTIGTSSVKTVFIVDYIDLDYGYIGGYYSIGISGPAYGGGSGYMLLRLGKNAYPLSPALKAVSGASDINAEKVVGISNSINSSAKTKNKEPAVQVFPLNK